ncbi:MAG: TrkA C-terminal domain-containing protein [Myxococcota bacterium]|nr:TrkA C-terminal domain-containing protein [Myxococcota bacterium]
MIAILTLLTVIVVSVLVTRVAAVMLAHTGMSREMARFQARSAFTGVGFTTWESEAVVNHPVRRRIVLTLMLLGNAGFVTAVSTLILGFVGRQSPGEVWGRILVLAAGLAVLWRLATSAWVDRHLSRLVDRALRRFTDLEVRDYASLMQLGGDYKLSELTVDEDDWVADRPLRDTRLRDEGMIVLGVHRADGTYLGAPEGDTRIVPGDTLLIYGPEDSVAQLDARRQDASGEEQHRQATRDQARRREDQARRDPEARAEEGRGSEARSAASRGE